MTKFTIPNLNRFLALKLPSAYLSGIRVSSLSDHKATATVRHRWINQNPFNSLYWATQGMAAELATGVLMMKKIKESNQNISMLVVKQEGHFTKKATGKITFCCDEGKVIDDMLKTTISSGEGQILVLKASGINEENEMVSNWEFTWSLKLKT
jgi:hypothetical protein